MAETEKGRATVPSSRAVVVWQPPRTGDEEQLATSEAQQDSGDALLGERLRQSDADISLLSGSTVEMEQTEHQRHVLHQPATIVANVVQENDTTFITIAVPQTFELGGVVTAADVLQITSLVGQGQLFCTPGRVAPGFVVERADSAQEYVGSTSDSMQQMAASPPTQNLEDVEENQEGADSLQLSKETPSVPNASNVTEDGPQNGKQQVSNCEQQDSTASEFAEAATYAASSETPLLQVVPDDEGFGTNYLLSTTFLQCEWEHTTSGRHETALLPQALFGEKLKRLACPVLWELARKKLLKIQDVPMQHALEAADLGKVRATILQLMTKLKTAEHSPPGADQGAVIELCTSFRETIWVHTLRTLLLVNQKQPADASSLITQILANTKYKAALGRQNLKHLRVLRGIITTNPAPSDVINQDNVTGSTTGSDQDKNLRITSSERFPVRLLCSMDLLGQDELLDELQSVHLISFIERELIPPIDIVVDERNAMCLLHDGLLKDERSIKTFVIQLAPLQVQYDKMWIIVYTPFEDALLLLLHSALVNFRIDVAILISESGADTCEYIRAIVDACASMAARVHHVLPKLWYERPYLIEDESQHERFLASTGIINCFSAQSLLHKLSLLDLLSRSLEELQQVAGAAASEEQLTLLWSMLHNNHGIGFQPSSLESTSRMLPVFPFS